MALCGSSPCPGGCGKRDNAAQIAFFAWSAGLTDRKALETATAIALAESSGYEGAGGTYTDPQGHTQHVYGLWQVSTIHGTGTEPCDPVKAAASMATLSRGGTDWSAWTTYTNKTYLAHLPAAKLGVAKMLKAIPGMVTAGAQAAVGGGPDPCDGLPPIAKQLCQIVTFVTLGANWIRLGEAIGGAILILLALWLVLSHTQAGRDVKAGITKGATL